jgi:hypothetical protein
MNKYAVAFFFVVFILLLFFIKSLIFVYPHLPEPKILPEFESTYRYSQERSKCKDLCEQYITEDCNIETAVNYCLNKIYIDITGNKQRYELGKGGFVANLPYCEDGLYCFHIYDCKCGEMKLTPPNCRKILCDYYRKQRNNSKLDYEALIEVASSITGPNGINFGTCDPNVSNWKIKNPPTTIPACWWTDLAGFTKDCLPRTDPKDKNNYVCPEYLD